MVSVTSTLSVVLRAAIIVILLRFSPQKNRFDGGKSDKLSREKSKLEIYKSFLGRAMRGARTKPANEKNSKMRERLVR